MDKKQAKERLESLRADQDDLRTQLAELDTYMEKRARGAAAPPEPRQYAPRQYAPRPPAPRRYYDEPRYAPQQAPETDELLRENIEQSRRMMDKFDYLVDTLVASMEEVEGENVDEIIKTLAKTQMHVIDVMGAIRGAVEESRDNEATKEELLQLKEAQGKQYAELNNKINTLMEKVEKPGYLGELDAIRVSVSNLSSEMKRLAEAGSAEPTGAPASLPDNFNERVSSLEDRLLNLSSAVEGMGKHISNIEGATAEIASIMQQLNEMKSSISAKEDQILSETDIRSSALEREIAQLGTSLEGVKSLEERLEQAAKKFDGIDKWLEKFPAEGAVGLDEVKNELAALKAGLPKTSGGEAVNELSGRMDSIDSALAEINKKLASSKSAEIESTLKKLSKDIEEIKKKGLSPPK